MSGPLVGYQYVVMRCVPRVDRDEFLNVGVVLYSQQADDGMGHGNSPRVGTRPKAGM